MRMNFFLFFKLKVVMRVLYPPFENCPLIIGFKSQLFKRMETFKENTNSFNVILCFALTRILTPLIRMKIRRKTDQSREKMEFLSRKVLLREKKMVKNLYILVL